MFYFILQYAIISLILISIIHYLYSFFKTNLTVPKVKDLVNRPAGVYKEIYETIEKETMSGRENNKITINVNNPTTSSQSMKDDLKNFLSNLNTSTNTSDSMTMQSSTGSFGTMDYGSSSFSTF
jgi:hypothetical protein